MRSPPASAEQTIDLERARLAARRRGWTTSVLGHLLLLGWLTCSPTERTPLTAAAAVPVTVALTEAADEPDDRPGASGGGSARDRPALAPPAAPPLPREPRPQPAAARLAEATAAEGVAVPVDPDPPPDPEPLPDPALALAVAPADEPEPDLLPEPELPEPEPPVAEPPPQRSEAPPDPAAPVLAQGDTETETEPAADPGPGGGGPGSSISPGTGAGRGPGRGTGTESSGDGRRRRRPELAGRVIGADRFGGRGGGGRSVERAGHGSGPYVSVHEATTLRTHDFFPRLPAHLWPSLRPYVVVVDLCVTPEGRVGDAEFLVRASATLDPIVLAAVRTWRYRPRLVRGTPTPFCHLITIQYEPA